MRLALRVALLLAVFFGVGGLAVRGVIRHASASTPVAEVRLSAAMAGLFAGGAAAVVVGIILVWRRQA
jgi:hypothetical protein